MSKPEKSKLLFHVCCVPCSGFLSRRLMADFAVSVYFDNSNIWPDAEFKKRAGEAEKYFQSQGVDFIMAERDYDEWKKMASGLEGEPEKGKRCRLCYHQRLKRAAEFAAIGGFDYFTTSLLVSPWKDDRAIRNLGSALAKKHGIKFLADDFQADNGYKKASAFAREQGFYRQKYCGCEFSLPARS